MIKSFLHILCFVFLFSCSMESENEKKEVNTHDSLNQYLHLFPELPDCIKDLPIGISVWNQPDSIYAEIQKDSGKYIWKHATYIKSLVDSLSIVEFGTYNYKEKGWELGNLTQKPYSFENFDKWYMKKSKDILTWEHPEKGLILKDEVFVDPSNFCVRNINLVERKGLWYFIGVDKKGKKWAGYGTYVTIPSLKPF